MKTVTLEKRLELRKPNLDRYSIMNQDWRNLLFLHWEFDPAEIQKTLPPGLYVDTYEQKAYVGIVPFEFKELSIAGIPALGMSDYLELNVRTYVYDKYGTPGIWFYSLDLNGIIGVEAAKRYFALPYSYAELSYKVGELHAFKGKRLESPSCFMDFTYEVYEDPLPSEPGSLNFFLIERYALFIFSLNKLYVQKVHHKPYPLVGARLIDWKTDIFEVSGLKSPESGPVHTVFSTGVDVEIYNSVRVE